MNQEEYYRVSEDKNLPLRCPILNYCERRASTIYLTSDYSKYARGETPLEMLINDGVVPIDFDNKKIRIQGEIPSKIGGYSNFYMADMCPEVNLFESSHSLFKNTACTDGDYDKEREYNKKRVYKTQHFSRCTEFNFYTFEKKRGTGKKRTTIPQKTKALLQKEINSQCPFCKNEDVDHFQIHHIDEEPTNNDFINLLMLCPTCHSKITKGDIKVNDVIQLKSNLNIK